MEVIKKMQCVVEVMKWFFEDVIAPILIALFTVWLTEKYGKEKEKRDRKAQLQYQYLEKILDEVNLLDKKLFEYSRNIEICLSKHDPEKRFAIANEIQERTSEINVYLLAMESSLQPVSMELDVGIDIKIIHTEVGNYVTNMHKLFDDFLCKASTEEALEKNNILTIEIHKKIAEYNNCIAAKMNKLLE